MKTLIGSTLMLWFAAWTAQPMTWAQQAPTIEIGLHPVIRVTGEVGTTYVIESTTDVEGDFWLTRALLELTTPTAQWTDPVPTDSPRQVYRAVKVTKPAVQTIANVVWLPPGRFVMGSPVGERGRRVAEGPQTRVTLTKGFWIGKYEVTQREYLAVMGSNPSWFQPPNYPEDLDRPVEAVNWQDAVAYCAKLTEQERAAGRIGASRVYRLPTEAEWEYACRAGTTTRFSFGDALECSDACHYCALLDSHMWWCWNTGGTSHRVGQKLPNPWGLYDLHGNVLEMCQDWWSDNLPGGMVVDSQGPPTGSYRVVRGGGNRNDLLGSDGFARDCRSAYRIELDPGIRGFHLGFRVLLAAGQP